MLERSRAARCIVFLGDEERYLGAASPRDVRILLGTHYLVYEAAFASAYGPLGGLDPGIFKGGLSEPLVNGISNKFLTDSRIVVRAPPAKAIDWVHLERKPPDPSTWEFADWVTAGRLSDILGVHLSIGSAVGGAGAAGAETVKSIIAQRGPFVALVSPTGRFQALCDRAIVLESVARQAAE
jgi:hypothetical protein